MPILHWSTTISRSMWPKSRPKFPAERSDFREMWRNWNTSNVSTGFRTERAWCVKASGRFLERNIRTNSTLKSALAPECSCPTERFTRFIGTLVQKPNLSENLFFHRKLNKNSFTELNFFLNPEKVWARKRSNLRLTTFSSRVFCASSRDLRSEAQESFATEHSNSSPQNQRQCSSILCYPM